MKQLSNTDFKEVLRKADYKATPARLAVLAVLKKAIQPESAYEIIKKLRGIANPVTVYRTLESLVKAGIVRKVDFQHGHTHFELISGMSHHHHLICEHCGKVEDVEACDADDLGKRILKKSKSFASIKSHSLEFFGTCAKCAIRS